jgi:hypothetical protein
MRIPIKKLHIGIFRHPGFDEKGCLGCPCGDACCRHGADFDHEAFLLIKENWEILKEEAGMPLEDCFERKEEDKEFLGNKAHRSRQKNGFCVFHNNEGRGCMLFRLAFEKKIPWRAVPTICRMYPLTWDKGEIYVEENIESLCCCNLKNVKGAKRKPLSETQKEHIKDIFDIDST